MVNLNSSEYIDMIVFPSDKYVQKYIEIKDLDLENKRLAK